MKEVTVMLAPNYDQTFRRGVHNDRGERTETLVFTRGEPVRVSAELFPTIQRDIGHALLVCKETKNGVLRGDHDATARFKEFLETGKASPKRAPAKTTGKKKVSDEPARSDGASDEPAAA